MIGFSKIKKYKKRIIIFTFLAVIIAIISIYINLIFYRSDIFLVRVSPATNSVTRVLAAEKTGDTVELKSEDLNGIIELNLKNKKTFGPVTISGIYTELSDGKITVSIPARYAMFNFFLTTKGTLTYENGNILFAPDSFAVGKLALSKDFVLDKLKAYVTGIKISNSKIVINKSLLPFDMASITFRKDNMIIFVNKQPEAPKPTSEGIAPATDTTKTTPITPAQAAHDLLVRANSQLSGVRSSAASPGEKDIVSKMQSVINKMINNPSYAYQSEAAAVQVNYNNLPGADRSDLKNAILDNMEMATLKKLQSTFGF